jgi:uncharacterized membrane protein YheB (UPF0754 family)
VCCGKKKCVCNKCGCKNSKKKIKKTTKKELNSELNSELKYEKTSNKKIIPFNKKQEDQKILIKRALLGAAGLVTLGAGGYIAYRNKDNLKSKGNEIVEKTKSVSENVKKYINSLFKKDIKKENKDKIYNYLTKATERTSKEPSQNRLQTKNLEAIEYVNKLIKEHHLATSSDESECSILNRVHKIISERCKMSHVYPEDISKCVSKNINSMEFLKYFNELACI